jgi:chitinase
VRLCLAYDNEAIQTLRFSVGLAWYGHDYKLKSSSCVGYNCTMTGGGFKGECTDEPGILAQFEIEEFVETNKILPTLDIESLTWWFDKDVRATSILVCSAIHTCVEPGFTCDL